MVHTVYGVFIATDPTWNETSVDHRVLGYGGEVEGTMSDSDDDDDGSILQWSSASPRGVRRAESLEGPYSLLSLPLPSDAPDSGRRGSDRDSPGRSSNPARSSKSLDERLDELLAKGKLGEGMSPPSSVSDQQSDVESDSLSEEELDIIKLRKPVIVTLQPGTAKTVTPQLKSPERNSSDRISDSPKLADRVPPVTEKVAPLTDDMVDQIVRMKPMQAKAARQPSQVAGMSSPEDLSVKSHHNLPVDLSSKPAGSGKVLPFYSESASSCGDTACTSASLSTTVGSNVPAVSSVPVSTSVSYTSHCSQESSCRSSSVTEPQCPTSSGDVQIMTEAVDRMPVKNSTLTSPAFVSSVPSVSVQQLSSSSSTDSSAITQSADGASGCQTRASLQYIRQLESNSVPSTASRYCISFVV